MMSKLIFMGLVITTLACNTSQNLQEPEPSTMKGDVTKAKQSYCGVSDPINQLEWLNAKVKTFENFKVGQYYVSVARYDQTFYFLAGSTSSSSPASEIFDCDGKTALKTLGVSYNDFMAKAEVVQTLYSKK